MIPLRNSETFKKPYQPVIMTKYMVVLPIERVPYPKPQSDLKKTIPLLLSQNPNSLVKIYCPIQLIRNNLIK